MKYPLGNSNSIRIHWQSEGLPQFNLNLKNPEEKEWIFASSLRMSYKAIDINLQATDTFF